MTPETIMVLLGILLQLLLVGVFFLREHYRQHPAFFVYLLLGPLTDLSVLISKIYMPEFYLQSFLAQQVATELMLGTVFFEVARSLYKSNRTKSPQYFLIVFLFLIAAFLIWHLSPWTPRENLAPIEYALLCLEQIFVTTLLSGILSLVWWSNFHRLRWPAMSFRIVAGLSIYAVTAISVQLIHMHQPLGPAYHLLDEIQAGSYLGTLSYWLYVFS